MAGTESRNMKGKSNIFCINNLLHFTFLNTDMLNIDVAATNITNKKCQGPFIIRSFVAETNI